MIIMFYTICVPFQLMRPYNTRINCEVKQTFTFIWNGQWLWDCHTALKQKRVWLDQNSDFWLPFFFFFSFFSSSTQSTDKISPDSIKRLSKFRQKMCCDIWLNVSGNVTVLKQIIQFTYQNTICVYTKKHVNETYLKVQILNLAKM